MASTSNPSTQDRRNCGVVSRPLLEAGAESLLALRNNALHDWYFLKRAETDMCM